MIQPLSATRYRSVSGRNSFAGYTNHYNLVFRAVRVTSVNITSPWTVVSSRTRLASTAAAPRRREMISTSSFKGLRTDASKGISCLKSTQSLLRSTSIHADAEMRLKGETSAERRRRSRARDGAIPQRIQSTSMSRSTAGAATRRGAQNIRHDNE